VFGLVLKPKTPGLLTAAQQDGCAIPQPISKNRFPKTVFQKPPLPDQKNQSFDDTMIRRKTETSSFLFSFFSFKTPHF
jgi:hypothetical protein